MEQNRIDLIFKKFDDFRKLPSYQLERRFDIFLSIYLPEIIEKHFNTKDVKIIPEFPFRIGDFKTEHKRPNKSNKIDYLGVSDYSNTIYIIELKTDSGSIRKDQISFMKSILDYSFLDIVKGIIHIYKESAKTYSKYAKKHKYLIEKKLIEELNWVQKKGNDYEPISKNYEKKIVFILPVRKNIGEDIIQITYQEIIDNLSSDNDYLLNRMKESLKTWLEDPVN